MRFFYIHTFGCQMNEYDTDRVAQILTSRGWVRTTRTDDADVLLANTCTVRQLAEQKAFSLLGSWAKFKKKRPNILIGMIGCLAQQVGHSAFQRIPDIDFMAGPRALSKIPELIENVTCSKKKEFDFSILEFGAGITHPIGNTPSAQVAVMDGCNQKCSYCAVPQARGVEKSRKLEEILSEIQVRIDSGSKEIVLLGQNITRYGLDLNTGIDLAELLYRVAEKFTQLQRIRFLTGHPSAFSPRLIQAMADIPAVCEALHLPLQSGANSILKSMRRGYTKEFYRELIDKIRSKFPNLVLTTDIIVGFPGETDQDFQETLEMIEQCDFTAAYCFKFSPRKNTTAASLSDEPGQAVKEERLDHLLKILDTRSMSKNAMLVGQTLKVLVEGQDVRTQKRLQGRTRGNQVVNFDGPQKWIGEEISVEITAAANWSLLGESKVPCE